MKTLILFLTFILTGSLFGQYPPAAGQVGTTAIAKDSTVFVNWASKVATFNRGYLDIANSSLGLASFGDSTASLGIAEGNSSDVVSLGDLGSITLTFPNPIKNGNGPDFAVFENSFSDDFLELAHVEVSTDGITFVRIPSVSLTDASVQIGSFGFTDPTKIHNLAGKYRQGFGTPFDLEDIIDSTGINLDSINYVKIIDVVGTINSTYGTYDSQGNIINDPYTTAFESGGFDLDAIGVINENKFVGLEDNQALNFSVYPNPVNDILHLTNNTSGQIYIVNIEGKIVFSKQVQPNESINLNALKNGIYILHFSNTNDVVIKKIVINS